PDEPIGLVEWQRTQEQRLTDAEHRRAGADPEAGDRDAEHCGAPVEAQEPYRVADIADHVQHRNLADWTPRGWTGCLRSGFVERLCLSPQRADWFNHRGHGEVDPVSWTPN